MSPWKQDAVMRAQALARELIESGAATISSIARDTGYKRPTISVFLSGKLLGDPIHIARIVLARLGGGTVQCPHLNAPLPVADCVDWQDRPKPMSGVRAMLHWQHCRRCPMRQTARDVAAQLAASASSAAPAPPHAEGTRS